MHEVKIISFCILTWAAGVCRAAGCVKQRQEDSLKCESVNTVLHKLKRAGTELKSYQAEIEYLFHQPLFESQTLRKGRLYYQRADTGSALRINFQTLKQDDEKEKKYVEQYIFDGIWLTHIDYQMKQVKRYQQAEPNQPIDAFELAGKNFPILGFSTDEDLKKEFEIKLIEQPKEGKGLIRLDLKVKPGSIYAEDYTSVQFWIDKKLYLPARIVAVSTEEDIYEIRLLDAKVNERLGEAIFKVDIPEGFSQEVVQLEQEIK